LPASELAVSPHWSHSVLYLAPHVTADLADLLNSATTPGSSARGHALGLRADGPAPREQTPIEGIPIAPARLRAGWPSAWRRGPRRTSGRRGRRRSRSPGRRREARRKAGQSSGGAARDLRKNPRAKRPRACPREAVGSPGDSS
jgi:hypothetical protein